MTTTTSTKQQALGLTETRRRSRTYQILLACLLRHLRRPQAGEATPGVVPSRQPLHPAQEAA